MAAVILGLLLPASLPARDFDQPRTYLQFRSGEFDTAWDVHDYWGLSVGRNFDRHWGIELAADAYERYLELGEESVNVIMPQVRYRFPLWRDRLVPYVIAGMGPVFMQFNDRNAAGHGRDIDSEGWRVGAAFGGGVEYFFDNNLAFVVEGKYVWIDSMDLTVDGRTDRIDMSEPLFSIGLRAYLEQIPPEPYAEVASPVPSRYYFTVSYGGSVLTDDHFDGSIDLGPEPSALGGVWNQSAGLGLGANFGRHWGVELMLHGEERRLIDSQLGNLGEYAIASVSPRIRVRAPIRGGRWVPYAFGGVGATYGEYNDGTGRADVEGNGIYPSADLGAGFEWFVARNVSFHVDTLWNHTWGHELRVNDRVYHGSISSFQAHLGFRLYLFESRRRGL